MNCLQVEEQFSAYLEDELDYQTVKTFEAHLTSCESCHHEFTSFRKSVNLLHQLPQIEPSAGFNVALRRRLANIQVEPISSWYRALNMLRLRPVWAFSGFATIALVMLVSIYLYQNAFFKSPHAELASDLNTPSVIQRYVLPDEFGRQERLLSTPPYFNPQRPTNGLKFDGASVLQEQQPRRIERNYILQTVSYTDAPTGGGL